MKRTLWYACPLQEEEVLSLRHHVHRLSSAEHQNISKKTAHGVKYLSAKDLKPFPEPRPVTLTLGARPATSVSQATKPLSSALGCGIIRRSKEVLSVGRRESGDGVCATLPPGTPGRIRQLGRELRTAALCHC